MIRSVFDGDVAKGFSCARTKTTAILNGAVAPAFKRELIESMQRQPFTLATDGSNDTGLLKMNPITVKIFDSNRHRIDTGTTDGVNAATSAEIFSKILDVLRTCNVSWNNCVGFSVDNTSVNLGKHNSIKSRVLQVNPSVYFLGFPCHISHNIGNTASSAFALESGFDIEEMAIDLYYWFDKSYLHSEKNILLKEVVTLWVTMRGFSLAFSWLEKYKCIATKKMKGLIKKILSRAIDVSEEARTQLPQRRLLRILLMESSITCSVKSNPFLLPLLELGRLTPVF